MEDTARSWTKLIKLICFHVCCSSVSSFQESLLRMLLGIEILQVRFSVITSKRKLHFHKHSQNEKQYVLVQIHYHKSPIICPFFLIDFHH